MSHETHRGAGRAGASQLDELVVRGRQGNLCELETRDDSGLHGHGACAALHTCVKAVADNPSS